jgi:hypothetical protein
MQEPPEFKRSSSSGPVFHGVDTSNVVNEQTADDMKDGDEADFALAMERMAITVDSDEEDENFDFEMGHCE